MRKFETHNKLPEISCSFSVFHSTHNMANTKVHVFLVICVLFIGAFGIQSSSYTQNYNYESISSPYGLSVNNYVYSNSESGVNVYYGFSLTGATDLSLLNGAELTITKTDENGIVTVLKSENLTSSDTKLDFYFTPCASPNVNNKIYNIFSQKYLLK